MSTKKYQIMTPAKPKKWAIKKTLSAGLLLDVYQRRMPQGEVGKHGYNQGCEKDSRQTTENTHVGHLRSRTSEVEPIMLLSRSLTDAETRYWPTELEAAGLVWVIKKVRHFVEAAEQTIIVCTDHSATTVVVKQLSLNTSDISKLNLRLIRALEYLQRFRLDVRHRSGKSNIVPEALSRLASRDYRTGEEEDSPNEDGKEDENHEYENDNDGEDSQDNNEEDSALLSPTVTGVIFSMQTTSQPMQIL